MNLKQLGWNDHFDNALKNSQYSNLPPARVTRCYRDLWIVESETGEMEATLSGKFRFAQANQQAGLPTIGDWVLIEPRPDEPKGTIHELLKRTSSFNRKAPSSGGMPESGGETRVQALAANVDYAFLVAGLDYDFNVRRIERYLVAAYDSGATPVVVLNKADLCDDIEARRSDIEAVAFGVDIVVASALNADGVEPLIDYLSPGKTGVLLGSSGVGKSTLINSLLGEARMITHATREDDSRGRHTTTHRELVILPSGGILIDTPGLRELQLWAEEEALKQAFDDIEAFAPNCRFRDCQHLEEPGCAVKEAVERGELKAERLASYHKLKREMKRLEARQAGLDRHFEHVRGRKFASLIKEVKKLKNRYQ